MKKVELTGVKKTTAWNGEFAICPNCNKTMAHGFAPRGIKWACLFGCGLIVHEQPYHQPGFFVEVHNHVTKEEMAEIQAVFNP